MLNPQIAVQKNIPWIKRKLGDSPDETAFFRWPLRRLLEQTGYRDIRIDPFDFLHPKTPMPLINRVNQLGRFLEKMPVISEFAGSLYIRAAQMRSATTVSQNEEAKLMRGASVFRRIGNKAYKYAFPAYRFAYRIFKAYADRAERQLLQKILFPGAVVVDAGANIGIYSEFLSRCVGPNGVVHSFEPCPDNFMRLRCATRKLPNVQPLPGGGWRA